MKRLVLISALALLSTHVYSNAYQASVGTSVSGLSQTSGSDTDTAIGATFFGEAHFDLVDTRQGPLAEAWFVDKSAFISGAITKIKPDDSDFESSTLKLLHARFIESEQWIMELDISSLDGDNAIGVGFGGYLTDNLDVVFSHTNSEGFQVLSAKFHGLKPLDDIHTISYDAAISKLIADVGDDQYQVELGASYYFNRRLSVGVNYGHLSGDSLSGGNHFGAIADWFVVDNIRLTLNADYATTSSEPSQDVTEVSLAAAYRF